MYETQRAGEAHRCARGTAVALRGVSGDPGPGRVVDPGWRSHGRVQRRPCTCHTSLWAEQQGHGERPCALGRDGPGGGGRNPPGPCTAASRRDAHSRTTGSWTVCGPRGKPAPDWPCPQASWLPAAAHGPRAPHTQACVRVLPAPQRLQQPQRRLHARERRGLGREWLLWAHSLPGAPPSRLDPEPECSRESGHGRGPHRAIADFATWRKISYL